MKNSLNELSARENMLMREYSNINSTKYMWDIFEFCRNDNNQLREKERPSWNLKRDSKGFTKFTLK